MVQIIAQEPFFWQQYSKKNLSNILTAKAVIPILWRVDVSAHQLLGATKKRRRRLKMDATVKTPKSGSTKREKFRYIAEKRTNRALEAIARISNLSNRQIYEFEEAQVRKIIRALKDAVAEVESRFASPRGKPEAKFKLD